MLPDVVKDPLRATDEMEAVTVSVRSTSVTVSEPLVERVVLDSVREATSPAEVSVAVMSGVSLVPVMVMATVVVAEVEACGLVAPLLSASVRV